MVNGATCVVEHGSKFVVANTIVDVGDLDREWERKGDDTQLNGEIIGKDEMNQRRVGFLSTNDPTSHY